MPRSAKKLAESLPDVSQLDFQLPGVEHLSWADVDQELLSRVIEKVTDLGHAIIIGHTSDMGAFSLTLLLGSSKPRMYPVSVEHANNVLHAIVEWAESI